MMEAHFFGLFVMFAVISVILFGLLVFMASIANNSNRLYQVAKHDADVSRGAYRDALTRISQKEQELARTNSDNYNRFKLIRAIIEADSQEINDWLKLYEWLQNDKSDEEEDD